MLPHEIKKEKRKIHDKQHAQNRTKEEIVSYINELKRNNEEIILIEANKRRTNITINEGVLRLIETKYANKSGLIEELLIKLLEEEFNKKIEITKYKGNLEKY